MYTIVNVVLVCMLAPLSSRKFGQEKVWVDLGLCALFGKDVHPSIVKSHLGAERWFRWLHCSVHEGHQHSPEPCVDPNIQFLDHISSSGGASLFPQAQCDPEIELGVALVRYS